MMKNKKLTIFLIALLSVICVALVIFMVFAINGKIKFSKFLSSYKTSNELVINESYDNNFTTLDINSSSSEIYIKNSSDDTISVKIYGNKEDFSIDVNNNKLNIVGNEKDCVGICFNTIISKIVVYLPEGYNGNINIDNDYGNVEIESFKNSTIKVQEDCGNVKIINGKDITVNNAYGDITIDTVDTATITDDCGDIKVDLVNEITVKNDYGDIEVASVNGYLDIKNDCGDIKLNSINLTKNSSIKDDLGDIEIGKTNEIYFDAKTDLGDVKINNNYNKSDITLKIENDCGDIKVNN